MKRINRDEIRIADRLDETACQLEDDQRSDLPHSAPAVMAERYRARADAALSARSHLVALQRIAKHITGQSWTELMQGQDLADWLVQRGWTPPPGIEVEE